MFVFGLLSLLVTVGLPILVVVLVLRARSGRAGRPADGVSIRRFFQYLLLYVLTVVAVTGVADLLGRAVGGAPATADEGELARVLAFAVLGVPMAAGVAAWTRRGLRRDPGERASTAWAFYLWAASLTALGVAAAEAQQGLAAAFAGRADAAPLVRALVWLSVWTVHVLLGERTLTVSARAPHLAAGSLVGLVLTVTGLVQLGGTAGRLALDTGHAVVAQDVANAGALAVVGGLVWSAYWWGRYRRAEPDRLWLAYVLPVGVGGPFVVALVGAAIALAAVGVWFLGEPDETSAAAHFAGVPGAATAVVVGLCAWWYHRRVFSRAAPPGRTEITRAHEHLMAGIALVTAALGVVIGLRAVGDAVAGAASDPPANTFLLAATLLVVGTPVWWHFWGRAQRERRAQPDVEVRSVTRRLYLFLLFGVGALTGVVAVLVTGFVTIEAALRGDLGRATLTDVGTPLALLVTAAAVSGSHWVVYREDRALAVDRVPAAAAPTFPRDVLLLGPDDDALVRSVHDAGARVEVWVRPPEAVHGAGWDTAAVLGLLAQHPGGAVAVVLDDAGPSVVPVEAVRRPWVRAGAEPGHDVGRDRRAQ
ncbi:hypothetical protein AFE02nite_04520 [Actinotalea fermentans]|uniref:DUF5671 domain-containing protein n=2 Tax=Actinotalea fermentans TaxID=43671 RepID=A0A511YU44_9CELL|nr:hypothetical protein AFE02nite_04520 [Actinotalea fermentans]